MRKESEEKKDIAPAVGSPENEVRSAQDEAGGDGGDEWDNNERMKPQISLTTVLSSRQKVSTIKNSISYYL